jgi:hypothetical protein
MVTLAGAYCALFSCRCLADEERAKSGYFRVSATLTALRRFEVLKNNELRY